MRISLAKPGAVIRRLSWPPLSYIALLEQALKAPLSILAEEPNHPLATFIELLQRGCIQSDCGDARVGIGRWTFHRIKVCALRAIHFMGKKECSATSPLITPQFFKVRQITMKRGPGERSGGSWLGSFSGVAQRTLRWKTLQAVVRRAAA